MRKNLTIWLAAAVLLTACAVAAALALRNNAGRMRATLSATTPVPEEALPTLTPVRTPAVEPTPTSEPTPTPVPRSPTTGKRYADGETPVYRPVMVSIENSSGARPQTALNLADIIYEAPVEYAITRLHAVFNDQYPLFAGPVRSSRIYWMRLQQEWKCMYVHRGYGGPMFEHDWIGVHVESYIMDTGDMFWRDRSGRKDVHTLMVNVGELADAFYGDFQPEARERFRFHEQPERGEGKPFEKVALNFFYRRQDEKNWVTFAYDGETNTMRRYQDGRVWKTLTPVSGRSPSTYRTEKEEFFTQNLIVQYATFTELGDADRHRDADLTGTGLCDYFLGGRHYTGYWSRPAYEDCTRYYLDGGELVTLEPGRTWICIHPDDYALSPVAITYGDGTRLERTA